MANGHQIKLISFALFLFSELVVCKNRGSKSINRFEGYEDQDPIKLTRCDVICFRSGITERDKVSDKKLRWMMMPKLYFFVVLFFLVP